MIVINNMKKRGSVMKEDLDVKFKLFGIFLVVIEVIGIIYALFFSSEDSIFYYMSTLVIIIGGLLNMAITVIPFFALAYAFRKMYDMNKQIYDIQCNVSQTQRAVVQNQKNWKCNKCGTENASYVGTCSCGASRPTE